MIRKDITLDGQDMHTEADFHSIIAEMLDFGPYYGKNLDALWDRLSTDVERPVNIIWLHSDLSRQRLGERFDKIVQILERTKQQDIQFSWDEKFDYILK